MNTIQYILVSTACISIFYLAYLLVFKNEANFRQLRFYLLTSIILSTLIPLSSFKISFDFPGNQSTNETTSVESINGQGQIKNLQSLSSNNFEYGNKTNSSLGTIDWVKIIKIIYIIVSAILVFRIGIQVVILIIYFSKSERIKYDNYVVIRNDRLKNTFSFFNWIFINTDTSVEDEEDLISHEKIHASQYHSIDLILIELLAAVMWFNPLVWMMRNSIQLVHEYLADEGALSTGIDKLKYQALLINQVTEERLICLSSSFNHSLIKKRMIMMTKGKFNQRTKLRILTLVPLAAVLFLGMACINGQNKATAVAAVEPVKMNVLYIGVDNPMRIAASGYEASDLEVAIDNGTITGGNGEYVIRPKERGPAVVTVSSKGKEIKKTNFRVKFVPDPVAKIAGIKSGMIDKSLLIKQTGPVVELENFDFDLSFKMTEFTVSTTKGGQVYKAESKIGRFTDKQLQIIKESEPEQKIYIENIRATGPDGTLRNLGSIVITVK